MIRSHAWRVVAVVANAETGRDGAECQRPSNSVRPGLAAGSTVSGLPITAGGFAALPFPTIGRAFDLSPEVGSCVGHQTCTARSVRYFDGTSNVGISRAAVLAHFVEQ